VSDIFTTLDRSTALELLKLARRHHAGKEDLPPEIAAKRKQIDDAVRNAELFIAKLRVVDQAMIDDIVAMKVELDGLYAGWAERSSAAH